MKLVLGMIVKDEVESVKTLVGQASNHVDAIILTVSDEKSCKQLAKWAEELTRNKTPGMITVEHRPWNNRFDDARNHNMNLAKKGGATHYFWLDADDEFDFRTVEEIKTYAEQYDAIWLPYEYAHDENGVCITYHWRERIVNLEKDWEWRGWVHENLLSDEPITSKRLDIPVIHRSDHTKESTHRNHAILEEAYKETHDPRYIHYLGISYFTLGQYQEAIDILKEYVGVGGWDEEIYRSLIKMSEASHLLGRNEDAIQYALRAAALLPDYPDAYFTIAQYEFDDDNYKQCIEWLKVAFSKPQPETVSIQDPTIPDRAKLIGAICEHKLGNNRQALDILKSVKLVDVTPLLPEIEHEASIDRMVAILPALFKHYDNPEELWNRLKPEIKYDNRFRKIREALTKPKTWPKKSIVFFCGKGYEEWGPHTLDKGMGGSEEAVVYLSRELAKQGYDVTVFGEVSKPHLDVTHTGEGKTYEPRGVQWLPWTHIDKRDTFDTLILWRYPQFTTQFKANKMFIDMHDLIPSKIVRPYKDATYLFKSEFHAKKYPQVTNYKIIGNGIDKSHFAGKAKKKPNTVGYFSAYYRGLEMLLDMWPKIKEEVPDAKLDVYYGWQSWVSAEGENEFYQRMTRKLKEAEKLGVTEHGRVDHKTLAKKMQETQVWAYPTQFDEIHCITALKAQEAECWPVVTDVAALRETVQSGDKIETERIYSDEYNQRKFVKAVVAALRDSKRGTPVPNCDWSDVAKQWKEAIDG